MKRCFRMEISAVPIGVCARETPEEAFPRRFCGAKVAYLFSISRAMIRRWISLVPSPMVQSLTSR